MAIRSPERSCARASVQPHSSPYTRTACGFMAAVSNEYFQSLSWRT